AEFHEDFRAGGNVFRVLAGEEAHGFHGCAHTRSDERALGGVRNQRANDRATAREDAQVADVAAAVAHALHAALFIDVDVVGEVGINHDGVDVHALAGWHDDRFRHDVDAGHAAEAPRFRNVRHAALDRCADRDNGAAAQGHSFHQASGEHVA